MLEGREMKLDEHGEILVRGANVAAGYWQGKELKPVLNEEGWFHTGDIGELDADGNLYFKGRKKNVIVTREGMNVYPEDLESTLRQQPEVRDCVVVGLEQGGNAEPVCCAHPDAIPLTHTLWYSSPTVSWLIISKCAAGWSGPTKTFLARRPRSRRPPLSKPPRSNTSPAETVRLRSRPALSAI